MVVPLLPILGLLAAGGAARLGAPMVDQFAEDFAANRRAKRFDRNMPLGAFFDMQSGSPTAGLLRSDVTPEQFNAGLMASGLLAPGQLDMPFKLGELANQGAFERQALSEAGAWDRAALGAQSGMEQQAASDAAAAERIRLAGEQDRATLQAQPLEPLEPLMDFNDPAKFSDFVGGYTRRGQALTAADQTLDFLNEAWVPGGSLSANRAAELDAMLKLTALPAVAQDIMQAGAMGDEERPFFEAMATGNFSNYLTRDRDAGAKLRALVRVLHGQQLIDYSALGHSNLVPPGASPEERARILQGEYGIGGPVTPKPRLPPRDDSLAVD